jgi:hypothetical protein
MRVLRDLQRFSRSISKQECARNVARHVIEVEALQSVHNFPLDLIQRVFERPLWYAAFQLPTPPTIDQPSKQRGRAAEIYQ